MRILLPSREPAKKTARLVARLNPQLTLSEVHEAISGILGYRDWHDLLGTTGQLAATSDVGLPTIAQLIGRLADQLNIPDEDVQYAVTKGCLFRQDRVGLDEQLLLRTKLWRARFFGPQGRGKPGTVVKDAAFGSVPVYLKRPGQPSHVVTDMGNVGIRADFEIVTPRKPLPDFVPTRLWLPYGYWVLKDGARVIYSRDYKPMWRVDGDHVERLDPWLWIKGIEARVWFAEQAGTVEWYKGVPRELALSELARHRILELPRLVDVMPYLFDPDIGSVDDAVERLKARRQALESTDLAS
jgi:hypothetical protein